jgi:hypothetical protein
VLHGLEAWDLLDLPLEEPLEVTMSWSPFSFWLVPDKPAAARLVADGIPRSRIWTTAELLPLSGLTPAEARRRARDKLAGDGVRAGDGSNG